jgi:hypothetical protein
LFVAAMFPDRWGCQLFFIFRSPEPILAVLVLPVQREF